MTKKFNRKIIVTCLAAVVAIAVFMALLVIFFAKEQKDAYTGYDGYIWHGDERSNNRSEEKILSDDTFEHTLEVAGTMAKYFGGGYIDLSNSYIALLPYYKKYSNTVIFSETKIKIITVFAKQEGSLDVGIANVENVVKSRTSQQSIEVKNVQTFHVTSGQTAIDFDDPIYVGKDETIVLGGNNSVSLYYANNIPVYDEAGNFTQIDGEAHDELLQNTGGGNYNDTLAVEVKVITEEEKPIFENLREEVKNTVGDLSVMNYVGDDSWGTYIYGNEKLFSGKTITKIGVPVKTLTQVNGRTYLDLYLINSFDKPTSTEAINDRNFAGDHADAQNFLNKHRIAPLEVKAERFSLELENLAKQNYGGYGWVDFD